MQVILLERIEKLGQMGDVVTVKNGYARNFLLPKGKALRATEANQSIFDGQRAQLETRNLEQRGEAQSVADRLDGQNFVVIRQAGDSGQLYGSVSGRDIADTVTENGFSVARNQVVLDRPIKALGLHEVRIALHPEVTANVTINVARTEEEAVRQARGEDITLDRFDDEQQEEDEEAIAPEDVFEEAAEAELETLAGETDASELETPAEEATRTVETGNGAPGDGESRS
jgi:large subunit ribosomal protein L9